MAEHWHIIRCTSGQEVKAEAHLDRLGYSGGWHPTEKIRLPEDVYQRLLKSAKTKGQKPKRYKTRPYVYGYVFIPSDEVETHRINGTHTTQLWMDVVCVDGAPYRVTDETMMAMRSIPDRLREMLDEAERLAREEWEAKRPVVGKRAKVIDGVFEGHVGVVSEDNGKTIKFDDGGLLGLVHVPITHAERVA